MRDGQLVVLRRNGDYTARDALLEAVADLEPGARVAIAVRQPDGEVVCYFGGQGLTNEQAYFMSHVMVQRIDENE